MRWSLNAFLSRLGPASPLYIVTEFVADLDPCLPAVPLDPWQRLRFYSNILQSSSLVVVVAAVAVVSKLSDIHRGC
jgi:hypothetical protein